jgi:hypothetical protein
MPTKKFFQGLTSLKLGQLWGSQAEAGSGEFIKPSKPQTWGLTT